MAARQKKVKTIEVEEYGLILYTIFGTFKVFSEIPRSRFVTDLHNAVINPNPEFTGWFEFEQIEGAKISLNLRDIRGIEEIPEDE
jgi:hypothetical protein